MDSQYLAHELAKAEQRIADLEHLVRTADALLVDKIAGGEDAYVAYLRDRAQWKRDAHRIVAIDPAR